MIIRKNSYNIEPNSPRVWLPSRIFINYWITSYCILVSDSENYILRSSLKFKNQIQKQQLKTDLQLCFGQEANHARVHKEFANQITEQGYHIKTFLKLNKFINFKILESLFSNKFKLAVAAAMEQINTSIALQGLKFNVIEKAPVEIKNMVNWHFVEEIEHRFVIFDLMNELKISQFMKVISIALVYTSFIFWITLGAFILAIQDFKYFFNFRFLLDFIRFLFTKEKFVLRMIPAVIRFCKKKYNPKNENIPDFFYILQKEI